MQTRNTMLMAVLLVVLGAFVYFYEIRGREDREESERLAGLLVQFEVEDVAAVSVTTSDGTVRATKADGEWSIAEPLSTAADAATIDALVDAVKAAVQDRLIVEAADDLAPFGLAEPTVSVALEMSDGTTHTVAIGKNTPVGNNLYATVDATGNVYSTAQALRGSTDKTLFDLRDKTVVDLDEDTVVRIEVTRDSLRADLRRDAANSDLWNASEPFSGRADSDTVDDLLGGITSTEAAAFVLDTTPTPEQLAGYGLDNASTRISLWTGDDSALRLLLGAASTEPEGLYAMREGGTSVFVLDASVLDDVPTRAEALRNKQVLDLRRGDVTAVEFDNGGGDTIRAERDGVDWNLTAPRPLAGDASVMSSVLSALEDLRAEGFADATPSGPRTTVRVDISSNDADATPTTLEVSFGGERNIVPLSAADDDEAEEIVVAYVTRTGDDTVYLVPDEDLADLRMTLLDLRDKTIVEFTQTELTEFELQTPAARYVLQSADDVWTVAEPAGLEVDASVVTDALWDLNFLRMDGVAVEWDGDAPDLSTYGLDTPRFRAQLTTADGVVATLEVGNDSTGADSEGLVYARVDGQSAVYEVGATVVDSLAALAEALAGGS